MDKAQDRVRHQTQNQMVLIAVACFLAGALSALLLGALTPQQLTSSDEWLNVSISLCATIISGYAVFLVSRTLTATQETLRVTQAMADGQNRIGEAQTRPWLFSVSGTNCDIEEIWGDEEYTTISLKNFGSTPAQSVSLTLSAKANSGAHDTGHAPHWPPVDLPTIAPYETYQHRVSGELGRAEFLVIEIEYTGPTNPTGEKYRTQEFYHIGHDPFSNTILTKVTQAPTISPLPT